MQTNIGGSRERRMAQEIVKLEQENERLRAALQQIADIDYRGNAHPSLHIARAALAGEKKDG